ncbi:MAG: outer membrane protein assembly factor BamA [Spirochaetales bacterium]|nr:outer membrane protein assembly factor BamA [Spirochaetales bacterium]
MTFKRILTAVLMSAISVSIFAQAAPNPTVGAPPAASEPVNPVEWYMNKPIQNIRFEGLKSVQPSELDGVVRPYIGKPFTNELFQELQGDLYNLDYFEGLIAPTAIKADPAGSQVILLFKVHEKPLISDILFSGNSKVGTNDLFGVIKSKKGDIINRSKVKTDEKALLDYYHNHGYLAAKVSSDVEEEPGHGAKIFFTIDEGNQTAVRHIQFQGLSFATESTLKGIMDTKEKGFFEAGLFKEATFAKDLRTIEEYYWDRGYIDAKIVDVQKKTVFDKASNSDMLDILITIHEGHQFTFGGFSFHGNAIFDTKTLEGLVRQPVGSVLDKSRVEADFQRIVDLYYENGYIFNEIKKTEVRSGHKVSYVIDIVERPRAHIESIIIKGNTKTHRKVITRELPIEVGDVFSKAKILQGIRNLQNLQYFDSVVPETPQGSADGLMDLVLNVEEGKTADLSFGLSFSGATTFPVSAQIKWGDKNFMGEGYDFNVSSSLSPIIQSINTSFTDNWAFDQRLTLGGSFGFSHAINQNIPNDMNPPLSTGLDTAVPDPYNPTDYVFSQNTTFNGTQYNAGAAFPGVPTQANISQYNLITRYQYDLSTNNAQYSVMQYEAYAFNLGVNSGYAWFTPFGRFSIGSGLQSGLQYVTYDANLFRPANQAVRDNNNNWQFNNQWWTKVAWDTRDLIVNPTSGGILSETLTFDGGFLVGQSSWTRSDTRADFYYKILEVPIFDNYTFEWVFKLRSNVSVLMPGLGGPSDIVAQPTELLSVDGMLNGRGWGYIYNLNGVWNNGAEFRFPVIPNFIWLDTFVDESTLLYNGGAYTSFGQVPYGQRHFSWGTGLRVVSPQFPIGVYLAKPFLIDNSGTIQWQKGQGIFGPQADMTLVIAFGYNM